MSTRYEQIGRTRQKARTRAALLDAARALLVEGENPTVERAADRALVSRATAYRYFPNQRALLTSLYPEMGKSSLLADSLPSDPVARLDVTTEQIGRQILVHEPELRTQLRLSLEPRGPDDEPLVLRQGRALVWLEDAVAPLRQQMKSRDVRRLVLAIRATLGIESLVWLTDVAGVSREEAVEIMRDSARTLLHAAMAAHGIAS